MGTLLGRKRATQGGEVSKDKDMEGTETDFEYIYVVQATASDDITSILATGGVPQLRQRVENAYCVDRNADEVEHLVWEIRCTFSSTGSSGDEGDGGQGLNSVEISWGLEERDEIVQFDTIETDPGTGRPIPIANSVWEPFLTTVPVPIPVLTIKRIEAHFNADTILNFNGKVNDSEFYGAPKKSALMHGPTAIRKDVEGQSVWEVTYIIKFNMRKDPETGIKTGWIRFFLQQGTRYRTAPYKVAGVFKDYTIEGSPATCNLNHNGTLRSLDVQPLYAGFNVYEEADFDDLNLE